MGHRYPKDAVDVNGDGFRDVAVLKYASGGSSNVPIAVVLGNEDGNSEPLSNPCSHTTRKGAVHRPQTRLFLVTSMQMAWAISSRDWMTMGMPEVHGSIRG